MPDDIEPTLEETREYIADHAARRTKGVPPGAIAEHVIRITEGADFPVRRAAFDAITRRWDKAIEEELVVLDAPPSPLSGSYVIGVKGSKRGRRAPAVPRPYDTIVDDALALRGQCSCPDFLKGSLALCKHLVVAFTYAHKKPARSRKVTPRSVQKVANTALHWDPIMPLLGPGDRLFGLRAEVKAAGALPHGFKKNGDMDRRVLSSPARRLDALHNLLERSRASSKDRERIEAGPAVIALLESELAHVEREQRALHQSSAAIRGLSSLKRELFPFQREAVHRILKAGRHLLADDMGLGKTTQAIAVCHALFEAGIVTRGLIITPATLKNQWLREWRETSDTPVVVVDGDAKKRAEIIEGFERGFMILNYEILLRDFESIAPLADQLVVVDEAQRIKNYATKSAVYVKALSAERRLILTGTPMENHLDELASLLDWIDDRAMAPKWRLVPWYIQHSTTASREKVGMRNLGTLRARIGGSIVRRTRKEVLTQLPKRVDTRVPVPMTPEQTAEHDALTPPIKKILAQASKRGLRREEFLILMGLLTKQRIISNGLAQLRFDEVWPRLEVSKPTRALLTSLEAPKLDELRRLIEALVVDQGRKVVVFSQWRRMLRLASWAVSDLLEIADARSLFFTGAESSKMRTQSLIDFHDDPRAKVLFLTDAGGVGLNLQKAASACVNLELPWNPAVLEQRIGRIYRMGQTQPIDVFNLVAEPGIESRIAQVVGTKKAMFGGVFESTSADVRFEAAGGFIAEIRQLLDLEIPTAPELTPSDDNRINTAAEAVAKVLEHHENDAPSDDHAVGVDDADSLPATAAPPTTHETAETPETKPGLAPGEGENGASETHSAAESSSSMDMGSMAAMLGAMRVSTTPEGGLRIDAPREAAGALASMFELMARALRSQAAGLTSQLTDHRVHTCTESNRFHGGEGIGDAEIAGTGFGGARCFVTARQARGKSSH